MCFSRVGSKRGGILISFLIAAVMAGSFAVITTPAVKKIKDQARVAVTHVDLHQLQIALEMYYEDHGSYPASGNLNLVNALHPNYIGFSVDVLNELGEIIDPWKQAYVYEFQQSWTRYQLFSLGPDESIPSAISVPSGSLPLGGGDYGDVTKGVEKVQPITGVVTGTGGGMGIESGTTEIGVKETIPGEDEEEVAPEGEMDATPPQDIESPEEPPAPEPIEEPTPTEEPELPPAPTPPSANTTLALDAVANDSLIFLALTDFPTDVDLAGMDRKESILDNYSALSLTEFETVGGNFYFTGDPLTLNILDSDVVNGGVFIYRGNSLTISGTEDFSGEVQSQPLADANDDLDSAKNVLNSEFVGDDSYNITAKDIFNNLNTFSVPIIWGHVPSIPIPGGELVTLAYTIFDDETGRELIVFNLSILGSSTQEELASILAHEGMHSFWNHGPPDLPAGITASSEADSSTLRGAAGRSFNSIDEEFTSFLLEARLWEQIKGTQTSPFIDEFLDILNDDGEEEARIFVRTLYNLEEY